MNVITKYKILNKYNVLSFIAMLLVLWISWAFVSNFIEILTMDYFAPDFAHYNDDVLFGENWNNEDIDLKTRCIITVVALMSSGITDSSLKYHLENAKNAGVTRKEIAAIITHVAFYVGWPKGWSVFNMAKEVWA